MLHSIDGVLLDIASAVAKSYQETIGRPKKDLEYLLYLCASWEYANMAIRSYDFFKKNPYLDPSGNCMYLPILGILMSYGLQLAGHISSDEAEKEFRLTEDIPEMRFNTNPYRPLYLAVSIFISTLSAIGLVNSIFPHELSAYVDTSIGNYSRAMVYYCIADYLKEIKLDPPRGKSVFARAGDYLKKSYTQKLNPTSTIDLQQNMLPLYCNYE
jgi:hypothetical protein